MGDLALVLLPMAVFGLLALLSLRFGAESRPGFDERPVRDDRPNWRRRSPGPAPARRPRPPPAPPRGGEPVARRPRRRRPAPAQRPRAPRPPAPDRSTARPSRSNVRPTTSQGRTTDVRPAGAPGAATIGACGPRTRPSRRWRRCPAARGSSPPSAPRTGSAWSGAPSATSCSAASRASSTSSSRATSPTPWRAWARARPRCTSASAPPPLRTPDGCTYDLVRARAETYPQPGALPEVRARRRSTRTCAAATSRSTRWRCGPAASSRGVPGAREDLRDGVLRVLHDASFADDPTRLWRRRALRRAAGLHGRPAHARARRRRRPGDRQRGPPGRRAAPGAARARPVRGAAAPRPRCTRRLLAAGLRRPRGRRARGAGPPAAARGVRTSSSWPRARAASTRRRSWRGWTTSASPRPTATSWAPPPGRRPPRRCTRRARRRRSRGRPGRAGGGGRAGRGRERPPLARRSSATCAWPSRATTCSPPGVPRGPEVGERLRRALDAKLDGRAPDRDAELRAALDGPRRALAWPRCPSSPTRPSPRPSAGPTATSRSTSSTATCASRRAAAACRAAPTRR